MRYWRLAPDPRLRSWVSCYWMVEPEPSNKEAAARHREQVLIPDGHSEIVFRIAGSFQRWRIDEPGKVALMDSSYVIGGRANSVVTRNVTSVRLAGVKIDSCALSRLIGMPLAEFRDSTVACADLPDRGLRDLEDAVANDFSPAQVAATLDRYFLRRLAGIERDRDVTPLLHRIRDQRGAVSILRWAQECRVDTRTLERRFVARMGMTPKQYARVVRFKHAYRGLTAVQADIHRTHLDAYYDESHFSREYRHFLGVTPGARRAREAASRTVIGDHLLEAE